MPKLKSKKAATKNKTETNNGIRNYFISKSTDNNANISNESKEATEINTSDSSDFDKTPSKEVRVKEEEKSKKRRKLSNDKEFKNFKSQPKRVSKRNTTIYITNSNSEDGSISSKSNTPVMELVAEPPEQSAKRGRPPKRKLEAVLLGEMNEITVNNEKHHDAPVPFECNDENLIKPSPCKSTISNHSAKSTVSSLFEFEKGASGCCCIVESSDEEPVEVAIVIKDDVTLCEITQSSNPCSPFKIGTKGKRKTMPMQSESSTDEIMEVDIVETKSKSLSKKKSTSDSEKTRKNKDTLVQTETPTRRSSRIQKIEEIKRLTQVENPDSDSDQPEDEDEDDFVVVKKKPVKIASIFLKGKDRIKEVKEVKEPEKVKKVISDDVLAFLHSGVPEQILKVQKQVEKKIDEEEFLSTIEYFPKITHVAYEKVEEFKDSFSFDIKDIKYILSDMIDEDIKIEIPPHAFYISLLSDDCKNAETLCNLFFPIDSKKNKISLISDITLGNSGDVFYPWIEKHKSVRSKCLAIDSEQVNQVQDWLKEWRRDIKDDGGTRRKEERKKRGRRDSDFIDDEEEDEFKDKSLIICGPPGVGKTAAVYSLAKKLGFKVVEMNYSSRRSGRDVLTGVEEATLSLNLDEAQNDPDAMSSCLVLIEDVDLIHPDEDEGFGGAVSQLITGACRPIVMTTSQGLRSEVDVKIERREPRWIGFEKQTASQIAEKALVPIIRNEFSIEEEKIQELIPTLEFIVRTTGNDVRRSINETQFLLENCDKDPKESVQKICPHLDTNFITWVKRNELSERKGSKCEEWGLLNSLSTSLSFISDLDVISPTLQHGDVEGELKENLQSFLTTKQNTRGFLDFHRALTLRNDDDLVKAKEVESLLEELGTYSETGDYNHETTSFIRTIYKTDLRNSSWKTAKRNGRQSFYFNRIEASLAKQITDSFGFNSQPSVVDLV